MQDFDSQAKAFSDQIEEELQEGRLNFPTSLDVSLRIKRLADNPGASLDDIAALVRAEPVLSAKTVRMANAVLLNPYSAQITSVNDAVKRIGLASLRCLAFAVAAEQLAQDHRSKNMRLIASGLWMHSVDVASWSYAFARHLRTMNPDTALLAGMMVDLGQFFLLSRASAYPALEENMNRFAEFVALWNEPVGRAVLEAFELPEDILDTFQYEDPYGGSWPPANLRDLVFVAGLAAETPNPFENLLGVKGRPELLGSCIAGIEKEKFDALLDAARDSKQEMLAAVCG
ncbi:HDOD domain-containing protein [Azoarcus indigens]|uniref:HD-like signal output (HDOD) protein n=1 Tax=Azoarcus indigens TaxID=29545 RepID=A0A4R6EH77_9RHOO|nr:HDOD domain-containing protein [Azoarcus indigens]NMG65383.1 HDOD domain-containing protein [Azoarcus indigens]TDN56767.1 HD-like signal output (HDOD) protein [Azoarcus indigens]